MKKLVLFSFVIIVGFTACSRKGVRLQRRHRFSQILKSKDIDYKFKMAEQFYVNKKYNFAQQLFEDLFPYVKGTDRYEDMYYKWAYCYYYQKDYLNAENYFKTFTETFPSSVKSEECEYMRDYTFYKQSPKPELDQTNTNKAIGLMQAFINMHPGSPKVNEANHIIDLCREKLETKDYLNAQLYYNLGYYKAAAITFSGVLDNYPDSKNGDLYKYQEVLSYFKYAEMSYPDKQLERYEKVKADCSEFMDRYQGSKYTNEIQKIKTETNNLIKNIQNEQAKKTAQR
jgi:outer membrane protein assembly factor BamD